MERKTSSPLFFSSVFEGKMGRYIVIRSFQGVLVIFLVSIVAFIVLRLIPGDPTSLLLGEGQVQLTEEDKRLILSSWGLDKPWFEQYVIWLGNMFTGNFGNSIIRQGVPISQMIAEALPVTLTLNLVAVLLAVGISIPLGIIAGAKKNSPFDYVITVVSTLGVATPNFWLGLMLIIIFAVIFKLLPPYGASNWTGYILPAFVLAFEQLAIFSRITRSSMIEALNQDYVRTARSKGLSNSAVLVGHAVRNALLPIVTVIGFQIAFLFSGTIVIETVFALPGLGRLFFDSLLRYDYQVVQAIVLLFSVLVVVVNIITDLVYGLVDPRIRVKK
jgi:peptide/nickel transport system permease protein